MASRCRAAVHAADRVHGMKERRPEEISTDGRLRESGRADGGEDTDRLGLIEEVAARVVRQLRDSAPDSGTVPEAFDDRLVFVVCSFDPDMDPIFDAIAAAAAAVGLRAERVKDVQGDYRITEKILALIQAARFIVADLSRERPNVYFELGYARGLGKTVITILRAGTNAHFDVRDWTYLEYIDSRPLEHQLRERFNFELQHGWPAIA